MRKVHLLILPLFVMYILIVVSSYIPILANNPVLKLFHKPLFSDYRWDYIKISIQGAFSSPITGIGLDNYRFINKIWQSLPYSWSAHGENHYLTLFTETGFMGGGIFLIMTFSILFYIYKHISADKLSDAGIFLALLASSLHVLFNPDWQFLSIFLYFFIGAGLLTSGSNLRSNYKFEGFNLPAKNISIFMMVLGITNVFGISFYYIGLKYNSPKLLSVSSFLSPGNIYLHSLLGNYYYQENDYEKAGKEYDLVSRMDPLEYSFYIRQGQINLVNGQLYMYEHNFLKAVYLDPKELQFYLVEAYKQLLNSADKALVNNNLVLSQEHISLSRDLFPEFSEIVMNDIDFIASLNEFKDTQTTREIEFIKKYINDGQKLDKYKSISSEKIKIMLLKLEENRQKIIDITSKKS